MVRASLCRFAGLNFIFLAFQQCMQKKPTKASSGQFSLQQAAQACLGENFSGRSALTSLDRAHLAMRLYKAHRKAWEKSLHYRPPKPAS